MYLTEEKNQKQGKGDWKKEIDKIEPKTEMVLATKRDNLHSTCNQANQLMDESITYKLGGHDKIWNVYISMLRKWKYNWSH